LTPLHFTRHHHNNNYENYTATIGNFDGVHLAHQALIKKTFELAANNNTKPAILTFEPHPLKILAPQHECLRILNLREKILKIHNSGIEHFFIPPFTHQFSHLTPQQFIEDIIIKKFRITHIVVGTNFTFGYKKQGDTTLLQALAAEYGIKATLLESITVQNVSCSSTTIRNYIKSGQIEQASNLLGHQYFVANRVRNNILYAKGLCLPPDGLYQASITLPLSNKAELEDGAIHNIQIHNHLIEIPHALQDGLYTKIFILNKIA
jgi:riboflavin kinase/FMN adenylyltransferase